MSRKQFENSASRPKPKPNSVRMSISVSHSMRDLIKLAAEEKGVSSSEWVRDVVFETLVMDYMHVIEKHEREP